MMFHAPSLSRYGITVAVAMLFVMPQRPALGAPPGLGGTEFDIPISELNKVKKITPAKRFHGENHKKRSAAKLLESASSAAAPAEAAVKANAPPVASQGASQPEAAHRNSPAVSEPAPGSEDIRIHHTPYSFVVAGRGTVIHAVISSRGDIVEVTCSVGAAENGALTVVNMEKVSGSNFTYAANLPPLPPGISALHYSINAVDSQGGKTRSREFVTPVTSSSPVIPSWQMERAGDAVSAGLKEEERKPVEDLAAPTVPEPVLACREESKKTESCGAVTVAPRQDSSR